MVDEPKAPDSEDKPITPDKEDKPVEPEKPQSGEETPKAEEKPNPIIEETIEDTIKKIEKEEEIKPRVVPESVLLEYKNQNKELKRDLKELRTLIESGATKKEISEDLRDIAAEHNVDVAFLNKLAKNIEVETEKKLAEKFEARFKPYEDKERIEKINKIFNQKYDESMERYPEYKDIANREIIRERALNKSNKDKTFYDLLKESYGHIISGKKTMEIARSRAGEDTITDIDYRRMATDMKYYEQIMADPLLKKQYNKDIGRRNRL